MVITGRFFFNLQILIEILQLKSKNKATRMDVYHKMEHTPLRHYRKIPRKQPDPERLRRLQEIYELQERDPARAADELHKLSLEDERKYREQREAVEREWRNARSAHLDIKTFDRHIRKLSELGYLEILPSKPKTYTLTMKGLQTLLYYCEHRYDQALCF